MTIDYTILVNRDHPIPVDHANRISLVRLHVEDDFFILAEEETAHAFLRMQEALARDGLRMAPFSGYRFAGTQQRIWNDSVLKHGLEHALRYVAKPGHSEHQTGLALDVEFFDQNGGRIEDDHAPEYDRMHLRLHEFGFILRYPEGAEAVTGYAYEPWHIRYVGIPAAAIIFENHWTLEEYTEMRRCL